MEKITPVLRDSNLYRYKGFCFLKKFMTPEFIDSLLDFEIRDDDVFLITFPKSGTIWTQQILSLICSEGYRKGTEQIETSNRIPWIEFPHVNDNTNHDANSRPSPRMFASHLSHKFVPRGLKNKKAKIIYVMRNPKDVITSLYHFEAMAIHAETSPDFDHFFEKFLDGDAGSSLLAAVFACRLRQSGTSLISSRHPQLLPAVLQCGHCHSIHAITFFAGSWFDHVQGWYTHKDDFNILFIKYEDMIMDLHSVVKRICTFLGKQLDNESLDIVLKRATFNEMKKDPLANKEKLPEVFFDSKNGKFMRKGTIGDWKNTMTVAQSETFDSIFKEKMRGLDLHFTWDISEKRCE